MIKKIISRIKKKVEPKEYFVRIETPEQLKYIDIALKRENAQLLSQVNKLVEENRKLKEFLKKQRDKEEKEYIEELKIHNQQIKKLKKENRFTIIFKCPPTQIMSVIRHKYFKSVDGVPYKYWRGIEIEDTKKGPLINFLVSKTPRDKKIGRLEGPPLEYFPYLFEDLKTVVQDLKSGRFIVNIDPSGNFIPPQISYQSSSEEDNTEDDTSDKKNKKFNKEIERIKTIDVKHLLKSKDPEVIDAILGLYNELGRALAEKERALRTEKRAIMDKIDAEITAESYESSFDRSTVLLSTALNKMETAYDKLSQSKVEEISARLKQTLSEMVSRRLWYALDNSLDQVSKLGREDREVIMEQLQKEIKFATNQVTNALLTAKGFIPKETGIPSPIEPTKKEVSK